MQYSKEKYPLQNETYQIIGICMEVHRILGKGLLEIVYKDAIEYELIVNFGENSLITKRLIL